MSSDGQPDRLGTLGRLVREGRSASGLSVTDAAGLAGLSRSQWTKFEGGTARAPRTQTLGRIEKALGWAPGSIAGYLDGGPEPAPAPKVVTFAEAGVREQFLAQVRRELSRDQQGELARQLLQVIVEARAWEEEHRG